MSLPIALATPPTIEAGNSLVKGRKEKAHPFWLGGTASMMSVCITHPIDQTKIRSQVQVPRKGMLATARASLAPGVLGLWTGLSGSLLRQATYSITRFGTYAYLGNLQRASGRTPSNWRLVGNGAIAGFFAGLVGAPAELVMVRMCADAVKPPQSRVLYSNALDGLWKVGRQEGVGRVFKGVELTVGRSVVMNASQLSCYDMIKKGLLSTRYFKDNVLTHMTSSFLGGTIAVTLCAPIDVIKSRVQSSLPGGPSGLSILKNSLRKEGPTVLFRGWLPAWLRMTPTTMLTFMFLEQLRKVF